MSDSAKLQLLDPPTAVLEQLVSQATKLVVYLTAPGILLFAAIEWFLGRATGTLGVYAALQVVAVVTYAVIRRRSFRNRAVMLAAYAVLVMMFSLMHYGPNIGTGVVMVAAAVWAGMLLGQRGAAAIAVAVAGLVVGIGFLSTQGWLPEAQVASQDVRSTTNWIRFTVTMTLCAGGLGWVMLRVLTSLEMSVVRAREVFFERELERERRDKAERELERAQRLDALGRLAAGVGRDINSALWVVQLNAEALATTDDPDQVELAEEIMVAVMTARDTAQQLAALSEHAPDVSEEMSVAAAIDKAMRGLERVIPSSIRVLRDIDAACDVAMSADAFERVLVNLCLNARDAMPQGGDMTITAKLAGQDRVVVEVADCGVGLSHEVREHMFEPFFTTKADGDGTGLGLTTVHRLVTSAGGHVSVESKQGEGTKFRIALPVVRVRERQPERPLDVATSSLRICLVDDEPTVRRVLTRMLCAEGHDVVPAKDGDVALELIKAAPFDALVTDVNLPGASVGEIISLFGERFPTGRVVVCSGHEAASVRAETDIPYVFLRKPFSPAELLLALDGVVNEV